MTKLVERLRYPNESLGDLLAEAADRIEELEKPDAGVLGTCMDCGDQYRSKHFCSALRQSGDADVL